MSTSDSNSNTTSNPSVKSGPVKSTLSQRAKSATTLASNAIEKKTTQVSHSDVPKSSILKDIINKNLQKMSNILKTRPEKSNTSAYSEISVTTNFQTLSDETLSAIYELEKIEKLKTMQLKIDKALLTLTVKLIEFGMYTKIIEPLQKLRSRLVNYFESTNISGATNAISFKSPTRQPVKNIATMKSSKDTPDVVKLLELSFFPVPINNKIPHIEVISSILSSLIYAIQCVIKLEEGKYIKLLPKYLRHKGNPIYWGQVLETVDPIQATTQLEFLMHIISKAISNVHNSTAENVSSTFLKLCYFYMYAFVLTKRFDLSKFFETSLRFTIGFERKCKDEQSASVYQELNAFYDETLTLVKTYISDAIECPKFLVWRNHYSYVARKNNNCKRLFEFYESIIGSLQESSQSKGSLQNLGNLLQIADLRIEIVHVALENLIYTLQIGDMIKRIREARDVFNELLHTHVEKKLSVKEMNALSQLFKVVKLVQHPIIKILELIEDASKEGHSDVTKKQTQALIQGQSFSLESNEESVYTCLKELIQVIVFYFNMICKNYFVEYKSHYLRENDSSYLNPENIILITIDLYDILSRLEFNINQLNAYKNCMTYIDKAHRIVQHTSCKEGLHSVLRAYCRIGNFYFMKNQYHIAKKPIYNACIILMQYINENQDSDKIKGKNKSFVKELEELKSHLSERYNVLGICLNKSGEYKEASKAFEQSLRNLPKRDFLQFSDLVSSQTVLSASQELPLIPSIINRYINSTYINCPDSEFTPIQDIFLESGHNYIDFAGLLEYELRVFKERVLNSLNIKFDFLNVEKTLIDTLLTCYLLEDFPIRRARVLIEKVKLMIFIENDSSQNTTLKYIEEAVDLLKTDNFGKDKNLRHLCSYYLATANSLIGILTLEWKHRSNESFESAFVIWENILKNIPPYFFGSTVMHKHIESTKKNIDDIERFYGQLQLLVDFFGVTNEPRNKIKTLNLMLSLNNGIRDAVDQYSDSVALYTQIGHTYLNLGYTGRAGIAFEKAKDILDSNICVGEVKLSWMLGYSHYLCAIGNVDKSISFFDQTTLVADNRQNSAVAARLARRRKNDQMLFADASYTRSCILLILGRLGEAISDVTQAIHLLNRMMRNVNLYGRYQDQANIQVNPFLVENHADNKKSNKEIFGGFLNLTAQRWKWSVLQMLFECNRHLGQLHILRGSAKEADYCFQQALELIQPTKANASISRILLSLAELEFRRNCWKESEEKINQAIEYQQKSVIFRKEEVLAKLCFGDFKYREGDFKFRQGDFDNQVQCYEFALDYYRMAVDILTNIMEEEYISKIEYLDTSVLQTPRSKKFVSHSDTPPKVKLIRDGGNECFLLAYLKSELFRRQGWILSKRGKIEEGLRLIEHEKFSNQSCLEKAEHILILSKVKIMEITTKLMSQNRLLYENIRDSVFSLPMMNDVVNKKSKKSMKLITSIITEEIDKTLEYLMEVYELAYECGPTHLLQEVSLCISMVVVIKASQLNINQSDMAVICSFYLEMTKALTAKREIYAALNEKLRSPLLYSDNHNQWPQKIAAFSSELDFLQDEDNSYLYDDETESRRNFLMTLTQQYKNESSLTYNDFQKEFLDILSPNWTVCSISVDIETNDMYICRYRQKTTPLLLRLPLKRQSSREGENDGFSYEDAIREFNNILDSCNQITRNPPTSKEWWKTRKELDVQLKDLLYNIENWWLGGFKGILMADNQESPNRILKFKEKMDSLLFEYDNGKLSGRRSKIKKLDIEIELYKSFLRLGSDAQDQDIEDILYFLVDAYNKYTDQQIGYDEIELDQLIIDIQKALSEDNSNTTDSNLDNQHVILILDKNVQMLPWESLPCLRFQAVSRLPSLSFLRDRIMLTEHVNKKGKKTGRSDYVINQHKIFYVLNPSQNLKHTQNEFEDFVKNIKGSDGIIGRIPTDQEWIDGLANKDLFMYFGHGAGEAYCKRNKIKHLDRCAVTLLFGCSSGQLKLGGEFDPSGIILSYLLAGSPAIVANLWDVTDVDFDRFSKSMFQNWGLDPNEELATKSKSNVSLVQAVTLAREVCNLKYLIGSAPVVYGIPCYLQR
ncbi:peptidase family C50-domain-containing protein [Glomus cerebriforme]|uniref:separase n=1 Tax=Glomus cerebriforme TaxID=658196 RepID=A0A397SLE3_9GLOM|nr:peptidase family C50-domain-containing protein [Glomus cerebriforme]